MDYDAVIIGAGLSGLAAGIRLAHFEKKVLIVDAHHVCGGLNSYYQRRGHTIDVGLHAMTNYVSDRRARTPLTKLLRQLRISYDDLDLVEQCTSSIRFPDCTLHFGNDIALLREEIANAFPDELRGFDSFRKHLLEFNEVSLHPQELSARIELNRFISEPLLIEMLITPLMYYGNAAEGDMDFTQFAIMWKSIYESGFSRPSKGMKHIIGLLEARFREAGGELRMGVPVSMLNTDRGHVNSITLGTGETITAKQIYSSAGYVETMRLCSGTPSGFMEHAVGRMTFVELITILTLPSNALGIKDSICFFSQQDKLDYSAPDQLVDLSSGVICCPDNFSHEIPPEHGVVRVTARASFEKWDALIQHDPHVTPGSSAVLYQQQKDKIEAEIIRATEQFVPNLSSHINFTDMFTPLTVRRFTGRLGGTVYGSPTKHRDGSTESDNLFIIGTDQGFLGIVGSMLSGITIANLHGLQK